ncbi:MAG: type II secretion system secretin GspD [Thiohalomonadales bacterium]
MYKKQNIANIGVIAQGKKCFLFALLTIFIFSSGNVWAEKFTLNFKGADIKAVITSVADITGKNFIVDPRVKGKATIISKRPMSKGEVYQVFLSVLEVHGYTAVPSGKIIKIIPDADAKHSGMPTVSEEDPGVGDEAVTRVIQIEHVTAAQLVPILRPLVPPQGHLAAYPQSNVLIISDRVRNINRLLSIIKRIDQPSSGEIEIVALEHAAASDLVRVLNSLQQQKGKGAKSNKPTLVADERTNSILIGGDRSQRLQLRAIISHLDTPSEVTGDTHVIYLRYAKAKDMVTVLTGVAESKKKASGRGKKGAARGATASSSVINIQADEASNALVITASPTVFRSLEGVVRQLDIRRAQVLVEAIIAEVSLNKVASLGVQWLFDGTANDKPIGAVDFTGIGAAAIKNSGGDISSLTNSSLSAAFTKGANIAFGKFGTEGTNFAGLLTALQSDANTNVLSTPSLVTLDNEDAEIFVGEEVSIPTGSFSSTGGGNNATNPFTTFERKPVGISLKVKPQINEGDAIQLEIEQKVDSLSSGVGSAGTGGVVTAERRIKTNVIVDNGSILVLGGLVKDDILESHSKVPLLGDIPLIGFLFRFESVQKIKTNLMVFLRPTILRDSRQSIMVTKSKYNLMESAQSTYVRNVVQLWLEGDAPTLPEFEGLLVLPPPFEDSKQSEKTLFDESDESLVPDELDF